VRYGAVLKDAGTGQIVGHLKETGDMASILSKLATSPLKIANAANPLSFVPDLIGQGYNAYQIKGVQRSVGEVKGLVEGLQLATNVAAISSVVGLGVSVAGFAVVNNKLKKIDAKIDAVADDVQIIKRVLSELSISWEAMSNARFQTAAETLIVAEKSDTEARRQELAKEATSEFALLRNYYSHLLQRKGLFEDISLDLDSLYEIVARYTVSCMGVLQAEFMTGDLGSYRTRLDTIQSEYADLVSFSPKELYLARCDQMEPLNLGLDHESLSKSLIAFSATSTENAARIESYSTELEYLQSNNLSVSHYLESLREHESDIVLLRR
jgi:hypothetical protein